LQPIFELVYYFGFYVGSHLVVHRNGCILVLCFSAGRQVRECAHVEGSPWAPTISRAAKSRVKKIDQSERSNLTVEFRKHPNQPFAKNKFIL
jgi:hypothetical protein